MLAFHFPKQEMGSVDLQMTSRPGVTAKQDVRDESRKLGNDFRDRRQ